MGLFSKNRKEKISIEIDKDLYADFCVKCAQTSINDVIEQLIKDFLGKKDIDIVSQKTYHCLFSDNNRKSSFKYYLTQIAQKTNGDHYVDNVANSYSSAINTISKYIEQSLWEMNSVEISKIIESLLKDDEFIKKDGNKTLSNGIKRYKEFLEYVETHSEDIEN